MKASELRIGNIFLEEVRGQKQEFIITAINSITHTAIDVDDNITSIDYLIPIPLTEEWLLKFGFDRPFAPPIYEIVTANLDKRFRIHKVGEKSWMLGYYESITASIEYVHQLQNLYFALTGEELEIKEQVTYT